MSCRVFGLGIVAGILLTSSALGVATDTPNPAASPSPAAAPSIAPLADKLLCRQRRPPDFTNYPCDRDDTAQNDLGHAPHADFRSAYLRMLHQP